MTATVAMQVEVRWGECDPAGIVYHPVYLDWFSTVRMHFLRRFGVPYMQSLHDAGLVIVVLSATCSYHKAVRAEDVVTVEATLRSLTRTRLVFTYRVLDTAGDVCATGRTEHAFLDLERKQPVNVAKRFPAVWDLLQRLPVAPEPPSRG